MSFWTECALTAPDDSTAATPAESDKLSDELKDYWDTGFRYDWKDWGFERYQNEKKNRSMKSCVKDWLADNPRELQYYVENGHAINKDAMDGNYKMPSKQMMKKEVAYLKSVLRNVADEMDKNGEWLRHSHRVDLRYAESFK